MIFSKSKGIKRIKLFLLLIILLLIHTTVITYAEENKLKSIKVGFFAFDGYHMQDENGLRSGYGYEILQHISSYAGLHLEYIGYDKSWNEMLQMLQNGEIDLLSSAQITPDRQQKFSFSSNNIGISSTILTTKAGNNLFAELDYANWNGIRVGMLEGNSRNTSFKKFASTNNFTYTPVYYSNLNEMISELQSNDNNKRIDAILTSNLRKRQNEWILAQFDPSPFFIMVQKDNQQLLNRINYAITQLDLCEPGIRTRLMNKYYIDNKNTDIAFTPSERDYIQKMKGQTLKAILNPDRAPYSWFENETYHGILYDIIQIIIKRSGLNIEILKAKDRKEYQRLYDEKIAALRLDMDCSYNQAENEMFWLTSPYLTVPLSRLYKKETKHFNTVAIPINKSSSTLLNIDMNNANIQIQNYDSIAETLKAIMDNKQDMTFLSEDSAKMAVRDDITNHFVSDELFDKKVTYCIAISYTQDPLLCSILTKTVSSISDTEKNIIRQKYADNLIKPFSIIGFFYDYPIRVISFIIFILSSIIIIMILAMKVKHRKDELVHAEKEHKQNELLRNALAAAEKADMAKGRFLSSVSHEMRTPLNAIIGFIELAKDNDADNEKIANCLASSDIAAKQLLNVINDVLDMSSIESGKMKIAQTPFNFRHLIYSLTNIYGTQCKQKGIIFESRITTPMQDWLIGDELRVNQILNNLLGNAVKFTSKGQIDLTISQTELDNKKVFIRFIVTDTGCGMTDEMQNRLFKPFEQESINTTRKYGGSGLGLSIVKNLVDMMHGKITVKSKQYEGTTFIVDLPFIKNDFNEKILQSQHIQSLHILSVDDEPSDREYMNLVLKRLGVRYKIVSNGNEALIELSKAEQENDIYNVCLIDWRMPGLNGYETTKQIREKYGNDLVVIVVSAYDFQQTESYATEVGANLFIAKPIFQSTLFDLFMTLTDGKIAETKEKPQVWDFKGKRILLVEDNELNQLVAKGYLAKFNVVVDLAVNGKFAVDMFKASKPGYYDVILMDIQMPEMDGYEATRQIRSCSHPQAKTIPIFAQSADAFNEDIAKALSVGMNAHVSKPIKPDILAKALHKVFIQGNEHKF